ncbi:MAG TPA: hypothetical protein ENN19_05870, partial [Chloroflexi bacterium]|nr:hypothetical protein [Chloroflexota bacterium]
MKKENEKLGALQAKLTLQRKKIDLILAIDRIRDGIPDPPAMLAAITNILADHFEASLCLLCLLDRESGDLALKAVNDRRSDETSQQLDALMTPALTQQIVEADGVLIWEG